MMLKTKRTTHHRVAKYVALAQAALLLFWGAFASAQENNRLQDIQVQSLPGERVEIRNKQVYINGERLEDPYGHFEDTSGSMRNPRDNFRSFVVPEGHVFVMGDNRDYSHDSRFWGPVPIDDILGKAFILYWSGDAKEFRPRWGRLGMRIPD